MPQLELTDHCKIITQIDNICIPENSTRTERLELPNKYKCNENCANMFKEKLNSENMEQLIFETEELISETEQLIHAGLIE